MSQPVVPPSNPPDSLPPPASSPTPDSTPGELSPHALTPRPRLFMVSLGLYALLMIFLAVMWYTTVYGKPKPPQPIQREVKIQLQDLLNTPAEPGATPPGYETTPPGSTTQP